MSKLLLFMFIHLILYYRYFLDVFCKQCHDAYFVIMNREVLAGAALMPPVVYDTTSHRDPKKLNLPKTPIVQSSFDNNLTGFGGFYFLMDSLEKHCAQWVIYLCSKEAVWNKIKMELNMPHVNFPYEHLQHLKTEYKCCTYPLNIVPIDTMVIHSYLSPDLKGFMKEFAKQNNMHVQEYVTPSK